jgi:hypothetical protein
MPALTVAINSTNVRNNDAGAIMAIRIVREDTTRVLALGAAAWGTAVAGAALEGAFALFEGSTLAAFAAAVSLYAVAVYFLDPQLRAYSARVGAMRARVLAAALVGALLASLAAGFASLALFLAPLAAIAGVAAAAHGARRAATSRSPAKSPGASRVAT